MDPPELDRPGSAHALRARSEPHEIVLVVDHLPTRSEITLLDENVRSLLKKTKDVPLVCDVSALDSPDAVTVEALCRLQVAVRRCGRGFELRHAGRELLELIAFMGLTECLPSASS